MRQAVMSDKMKEVRSTADFDAFLDQIDYERLLREKERADLKKTWSEEAEDHEWNLIKNQGIDLNAS
jgi:hypothetical protein